MFASQRSPRSDKRGLSVIELDASAWLHLQDFVLAMWNALTLPTDCPPALMNLDSFLVDENPDVGLAISIRRFDEFFRLDPHVAWQILDMFASHSRRAIVGRKLWLVLVGCGKKYVKIKPVGARPVDGQ